MKPPSCKSAPTPSVSNRSSGTSSTTPSNMAVPTASLPSPVARWILRKSKSPFRTTARAFLPRHWSASLKDSIGSTKPAPANRAAPVLASPLSNTSSKHTAVKSGPPANTATAPNSFSPSLPTQLHFNQPCYETGNYPTTNLELHSRRPKTLLQSDGGSGLAILNSAFRTPHSALLCRFPEVWTLEFEVFNSLPHALPPLHPRPIHRCPPQQTRRKGHPQRQRSERTPRRIRPEFQRSL